MQTRTIMTTLSKNKAVLGLSGGVDSTAAALLLKEKGLEVTGFYFDVLGTNEAGRRAAEELAEKLDIPLITMDVAAEFDEKIIGNFCSEYCRGRTPNPCVICNPMIKFRKLLEVADRMGAYYIATGHYARTAQRETDGPVFIRKGANERKDQSYMLYRLGQDVLSRLILPLGDFEDKEVTRELVRDRQLPNADAADSQEICFIDEKTDDHMSFIRRRGFASVKGDFVDLQGNVLGTHQGIGNYTVGQRKGLGIALGKPAFVTAIDAERNRVVLGDHEDLFHCHVVSSGNFFAESGTENLPDRLLGKEGITAKIRYAAKPASVKLTQRPDGKILAVFEEPQRAPAPGQSIVFYEEDRVVGGGFIE